MSSRRSTPDGAVLVSLYAALERHYDELLVYARCLVHCPVQAADIVQEAGLRVASGRLPRSVGNPRAYLYRVIRNIAVDHLRRHRVRAKVLAEDAGPDPAPAAEPAPEELLGARQQAEELFRVIDELPPRCREVFLLRKVYDVGQAEIAERLGISRNMVEKHLRKALLHCAERLGRLP